MTYATFLADGAESKKFGDWLLEVYPKNSSGVEVPLRFSRRGTVTPISAIVVGSDTIPANTLYSKRLLRAPSLTQSLWAPGQVLSSSLPSFGSALLTNKDGGLDAYMPSQGYVWAGCRYKAFFGDGRTNQLSSTVGKVAEGLMGDPQFSLEDVEIPLLGLESQFESVLSDRVYRGSSYFLELNAIRTVSYGSPSAVNITGALTLEGWVWQDADTAANVVYWGWAVAGLLPWAIVILPTRQYRFACHIGGVAETVTPAFVPSLGKWYHRSIVVSGRDVTFRFYDEDANTTTTETFVNGLSSAVRNTNVGGTYILGSSSTLRVWSDEMRVWNVARTLTEIEADRHRPIASGSIPTSLVHYARMDDGVGATIIDSSATTANGTITGGGSSQFLWAQEGGPELAGTPKPDVYGEKFGVSPVLVDPVRQGYQVAGAGAINNLTSYEGGLSHTMLASAANYRTYLTTTPAAGQSLRYLPKGLFKLGSSPLLPISATVEGYNGGALGYVNKGATVARDIITRRGPKLADPAGLDTASFTSYLAANPGIIGAFIEQPNAENSLKNTLDIVLRSGGGWWGYVRASTLFHVEKFAGPSATADYAFDQRRILSITSVPVPVVIYQVVVRYRENHVVHSEDQVAASIKGTVNWQQLTKQWQEKPATDEVLRAKHPGKASLSLTIETLLQYPEDAQALANYLLSTLKGKKDGWQVTVDATGLQVPVNSTATLQVVLQRDRQRLNLDGTKKFAILTVTDTPQEGKVILQMLG